MASIKLKHVISFIDARGKRRHQFRRKGMSDTTIKGIPGSPEFMERYQELLAQSESATARISESHVKTGTIDALILRYFNDAKSDKGFKTLSEATQVARRPILDRFRNFKTPNGRRYGDNRIGGADGLREASVDAWLNSMTRNPKKNARTTLRHLIAYAISIGECKTDVTANIKLARADKSKGHLTWHNEQIAQYRGHHANGTIARLAIELALNIAARRHDVHLIGRQHLRTIIVNGKPITALSWRPSKTAKTTGKVLTIPVKAPLQAALDATPRADALTFLLTDYGRPFASAAAFGNKFADWCRAAGLKPVVCDDGRIRSYRIHGLRKAACVQLAHLGCSAPEIMAVSGHATLAQVQIYIAEAEQERLAAAAMARFDMDQNEDNQRVTRSEGSV